MSDERPRLGSAVVGLLSGSSLKRRLLSGSAWASGGRVGGSMLGIITNGLLARMLSHRNWARTFWR